MKVALVKWQSPWILAVCWLPYLVAVFLSPPQLNRDDTWRVMQALGLIGVPLTGILLAHSRFPRWFFILNGSAAGLLQLDLLDSFFRRHTHGVAPGPTGTYFDDALWIVGVLLTMILLARAAPQWGQRIFTTPTDFSRCQQCGYLLYGLTSRQCPECGTPFEHDPPAAEN